MAQHDSYVFEDDALNCAYMDHYNHRYRVTQKDQRE